MFPVFIPPELAQHLRDIGIALPPHAKPRDSDASARDGISRQWKPTPGDEQPPF